MGTQSTTADQGATECTAEEVLAELTQILVKVIGADFLLETDVGMETSFNTDLCLESIQFVILAEEVRARYGDVDLVAWLAGMDLDAIIALRVGDLVELIVASVKGANAARPGGGPGQDG